jgi:hypothetical protein
MSHPKKKNWRPGWSPHRPVHQMNANLWVEAIGKQRWVISDSGQLMKIGVPFEAPPTKVPANWCIITQCRKTIPTEGG